MSMITIHDHPEFKIIDAYFNYLAEKWAKKTGCCKYGFIFSVQLPERKEDETIKKLAEVSAKHINDIMLKALDETK